ncbi:MAG: cpaB [Vampirovibrio sp.]|jgi:pilus assembly protein CpaB|nr:cpaB [Vampirovibrio sp.]
MPAPRRPKKVLVQFAVALVIAVVLGIGALVVGFSIINGVSSQAQKTQEDLLKEKQKLEDEKKRLMAEQASLDSKPRTFKVVQAVADLTPGQPITQEMVTVVTLDERPSTGTLNMLSQAVGKIVKAPIMKGEPLEMNKLLDAGGYVTVQDGMRAITINVDAIGGLNGALIPGSHVDVLTTVTKNDSSVTRTLLQNIQVVSVGNSSGSGAAKPATAGLPVTLIVTPKQAELLTLANTLGAFHLTLRNFNDKRTNRTAGADLTELMTGLSPAVMGKAMPPRMPQLPAGGNGFHNVNYSPDAMNLPSPSAAGPSGSKFSMQIYRGTGTETVDFQQ